MREWKICYLVEIYGGGDMGGCEAVDYRITVHRSMLLHCILLMSATKHGLPNGLVQYKRLYTRFDITYTIHESSKAIQLRSILRDWMVNCQTLDQVYS